MMTRIQVPQPDLFEQYRQTAQAIADLHYVLGIIVENATQLVPGEAVDDLKAGWDQSGGSLAQLAGRLFPTQADVDANVRGSFRKRMDKLATDLAAKRSPEPDVIDLEHSGLLGDTGRMKRSMLTRLKDVFLSYWLSEPRTDEKRKKAMESGSGYLDCAATFVGSIPGGDKVVEVVSLTKQLLGLRAKREA